jgi:hypothetical protein
MIFKTDETVLLDYKTGVPTQKDEKQMREYIATLKQMELPNVKGFLFYTFNNELKEIA